MIVLEGNGAPAAEEWIQRDSQIPFPPAYGNDLADGAKDDHWWNYLLLHDLSLWDHLVTGFSGIQK
jgi:hypothetical protein